MRGGSRQRTQVSDDGLGIPVIEVVEVHRRLNLVPIRTQALFQNSQHLFVAETGQTGERRRELGPIRGEMHRLNPNRRTLQPARTIELIIGVARSVAFRAFCDLLDEIAPVVERCRIGGPDLSSLPFPDAAGWMETEKQTERESYDQS